MPSKSPAQKEVQEEERLTQSGVLERDGWTKTLITKLLGEPDLVKTNPIVRSGSPMKLYAISRVIAAEVDPGNQEAFERARRLSKSGKERMMKKRFDTLREAFEWDADVEVLPEEELRALAIDSYNDRRLSKENSTLEPALTSSELPFLDRITVNYIRHSLTDYHRRLNELRRKIGRDMAEFYVKDAALRKIASVYPYLSHECDRQIAENKAKAEEFLGKRIINFNTYTGPLQ